MRRYGEVLENMADVGSAIALWPHCDENRVEMVLKCVCLACAYCTTKIGTPQGHTHYTHASTTALQHYTATHPQGHGLERHTATRLSSHTQTRKRTPTRSSRALKGTQEVINSAQETVKRLSRAHQQIRKIALDRRLISP